MKPSLSLFAATINESAVSDAANLRCVIVALPEKKYFNIILYKRS